MTWRAQTASSRPLLTAYVDLGGKGGFAHPFYCGVVGDGHGAPVQLALLVGGAISGEGNNDAELGLQVVDVRTGAIRIRDEALSPWRSVTQPCSDANALVSTIARSPEVHLEVGCAAALISYARSIRLQTPTSSSWPTMLRYVVTSSGGNESSTVFAQRKTPDGSIGMPAAVFVTSKYSLQFRIRFPLL